MCMCVCVCVCVCVYMCVCLCAYVLHYDISQHYCKCVVQSIVCKYEPSTAV